MKKLYALATLVVVSVLTLSACSSSSSSSSSTSTATSSATDASASAAPSAAGSAAPASDDAATTAIKQLADSVSSDFTEQQDKQLADDSENTVWLSKVQLPDMPCTIVLLKSTKEKSAPCSMKTKSQADADAAFAATKANVVAALPNLPSKDLPADPKYVAQALYMDDATAVLVLEQKKPDGSYMVSVSFQKASFFK